MPKFAIAFVMPSAEEQLHHRIIETSDKETALKKFFDEEMIKFYSNDEQGYFYFKEDFADTSSGSLILCE